MPFPCRDFSRLIIHQPYHISWPLNISGVQQAGFNVQLKLTFISKGDLFTTSRSTDKLPRFSFAVFGDHKYG